MVAKSPFSVSLLPWSGHLHLCSSRMVHWGTFLPSMETFLQKQQGFHSNLCSTHKSLMECGNQKKILFFQVNFLLSRISLRLLHLYAILLVIPNQRQCCFHELKWFQHEISELQSQNHRPGKDSEGLPIHSVAQFSVSWVFRLPLIPRKIFW